MATKKTRKAAAPKPKAPRRTKDPLSTAPSTAPSTPRATRDLTAPFPVKLRVEGATRAHLAALGLVLGKKARKVTRMDLRDYLLEKARVTLGELATTAPAQKNLPLAATEDDDLLG